MSSIVTIAGTSYSLPADGDSNWGNDVTSLLIQLATSTKVLQVSSSSFPLTQDLSFGTNFGLKLQYLKSQAANPASNGIVRLGNAENISWRNQANNADISLNVNASNKLNFNSIELADISSAQTLTNKTLTSPVLSNPSGLVKADVGLSNVDNTSDATKNSAVATLTNKTIDAASNTISNIVNANVSASAAIAYSKLNLATSIVNADISGSAAISYSKLNLATSILNADINASAAIARTKLSALTTSRAMVTDGSGFDSVSAVTSTELGYVSGVTSAIQTQLNAKISNTLTTTTGDMIYASSANNPARLPIGSAGQVIKSVGGVPTWATFSGGINYLSSNPDAEADTSGWATYADAAGTSPVDGTGGAPNSTWTRTTSSPLRGSGSFLFTKNSGASRQGEGVSYAFSIDTSDKAKVIQINFDYIIGSGTFVSGSSGVDSDLTVWIYDVTNATLIQPSNYKLLSTSTTIADKFSTSFQSASNSTSYRLIIHKGTTATAAFTAQFDNFNVGPSNYVYGTPVTDWTAYTPSLTLFGNGTATAFWRRVGSDIEIRAQLQVGSSVPTGVFTFSLPSGISIDTTKITTAQQSLGRAQYFNTASGANYVGTVAYASGTTLGFLGENAQYQWNATTPQVIPATTAQIFAVVSVAVVGWGASVQMSDSADTRVVAAIISGDAASATSGNPLIIPTVGFDSHGGYNNVTGRYTVAVPGIYKLFGALQSASAATTLTIYKNAVSAALCGNLDSNGEATFCGAVNCVAGDIIDIRPGGTVDPTNMTLNIERISGPSAIAASERVSFGATTTVATSIPSSTLTNIPFGNITENTHGAWSGSVFTVPTAGTYDVVGAIGGMSITGIVGRYFIPYVMKNGAAYRTPTQYVQIAGAQITSCFPFFASVPCVAGDTLEIRFVHNLGSTVSLNGTAEENYVSIKKQ